MSERPEVAAKRPELTSLTRAGLWYIYSATPKFWVMVARGFGLKIEPSDWAEETLRGAELDAAQAVRFIPIPLLTCVAVGYLTAWWRPPFNRFLTSLTDEGFVPLVRSAPLQALGHEYSQIGAIVLITFAVWALSLASVLAAFAPVWLVFRHQMRAAAPVVSVALAAGAGTPVAASADELSAYPRIRYAFGKLQNSRRSRR